MLISVIRDQAHKDCVQSVVTIDMQAFGFGLEPPLDATNGPGFAIPAGKYECWLRWSESHAMWLPSVEGVPGRSDIEIHTGNWPKDTKGCLLIGEERAVGCVTGSRNAFGALIDRFIKALPMSPVMIQYVNKVAAPAVAK